MTTDDKPKDSKTENLPAVAPGLDDGDKAPPPRRKNKPDQGGEATTESKEFGRLPFQPKCESCSNRLERDVRMVQIRADGPIATYRCPECDKRIKHGRPWRPNQSYGQAPNVAARPDMK